MRATLKSMVAKVMTAGLLAGALFFAAPKKADAAQFSIGVQVGAPVYGSNYMVYDYTAYPDYYARRDYYDHLRMEQARRAEIERQEWMRHQRHEEHERWEHSRGGYHGYYGR